MATGTSIVIGNKKISFENGIPLDSIDKQTEALLLERGLINKSKSGEISLNTPKD